MADLYSTVSQSTTASKRYKVWHGNIPEIIFTRVSIFLENDSMAIGGLVLPLHAQLNAALKMDLE